MPRLARWCLRHRRTVLLAWLLALVAAVGLDKAAGNAYQDKFSLPGTQSQQAVDLLRASFPAQAGESDTLVLHARSGTLRDPAVRGQATSVLTAVSRLPYVRAVLSPYTPAGASQVSRDATIGFASVVLTGQADQVPVSAIKTLVSTARRGGSPLLQVEMSGNAIGNAQRSGTSLSEGIGVVAAAVVLFVAFGSLFAMLLPLLATLLALGVGLSLVGLLTHAFSIASFAPTLAALIGLGVGIDYALFIVSRHRTGMLAGRDVEDSAVTAINTSGRAVLLAGVTVCVALLGQFALGVSFLYGVATASAVTVALTMLAAITLLPAMFGFLGPKVLSRRERRRLATDGPQPETTSGAWFRWAHAVQRRRTVLAVLAGLVMVALAVPVLSLRLGASDQGNDPSTQTTRRAYDLLATGFGPGFNGPFQLAAELRGPGDAAALARVSAAVAAQPGVVRVTPPRLSPTGRAATVLVYPATSPQDARTSSLLHRLRGTVVPRAEAGSTLVVHVGGAAATFDDFAHVLSGKLPLFVGVVVLLAFLLLMAVFRSLLVPLVASLMNLLSVGASFGIVVAVFQWGWGRQLVGIDRTGPVEAFLPVLLFSILFGLSMDYEVFLVSRMHEEWVNRGDNDTAVTLGQAETGRVITAAATIMILVFASFVLGGERVIKLFGLGLAFAVFVDAFVVRTVLVPALMHLLGRWNWWLPRGLDRVLPHVSVEAPEAGREPAGAREPVGAPR